MNKSNDAKNSIMLMTVALLLLGNAACEKKVAFDESTSVEAGSSAPAPSASPLPQVPVGKTGCAIGEADAEKIFDNSIGTFEPSVNSLQDCVDFCTSKHSYGCAWMGIVECENGDTECMANPNALANIKRGACHYFPDSTVTGPGGEKLPLKIVAQPQLGYGRWFSSVCRL